VSNSPTNYNSLALANTVHTLQLSRQIGQLDQIQRTQSAHVAELHSLGSAVADLSNQLVELLTLAKSPLASQSSELESRAANAMRQGWFDVALQDYLSALQLNPYSLSSNFYASLLNYTNDSLEEAREGFQRTFQFALPNNLEDSQQLDQFAIRIWHASESARFMYRIDSKIDHHESISRLEVNFQTLRRWIANNSQLLDGPVLPNSLERLDTCLADLRHSRDGQFESRSKALSSLSHLELLVAFTKGRFLDAAIIQILYPDIAKEFKREGEFESHFLEEAEGVFESSIMAKAQSEINQYLLTANLAFNLGGGSGVFQHFSAKQHTFADDFQSLKGKIVNLLQANFSFRDPPEFTFDKKPLLPLAFWTLSMTVLIVLGLTSLGYQGFQSCVSVVNPSMASGGERICGANLLGKWIFAALILITFVHVVALVLLRKRAIRKWRSEREKFDETYQEFLALRTASLQEHEFKVEGLRRLENSLQDVWGREFENFVRH